MNTYNPKSGFIKKRDKLFVNGEWEIVDMDHSMIGFPIDNSISHDVCREIPDLKLIEINEKEITIKKLKLTTISAILLQKELSIAIDLLT